MRQIRTDNRGQISTREAVLALLLVGMVVGGTAIIYALVVEPTVEVAFKKDRIDKTPAHSGFIVTVNWETYSKTNYQDTTIGDYLKSTEVLTRIYKDDNTVPATKLVLRSQYNTLVGSQSVTDAHGGDTYWVNGHKVESKVTTLHTPYTAKNGFSFGAAEDAFKCWWTQKWDNTDNATTALILKLDFRAETPGGRHLWDNEVNIPIRIRYQLQATKAEYVTGNVSCYVPFSEAPKEDIKLDVIGYIQEKLGNNEDDWNGILWKKLEVVTHTFWEFPLINSIFGTDIKVVTSEAIEYRTNAVDIWQDPTIWKEHHFKYEVR